MRNLKNFQRSHQSIPTGLELTSSAWDVASDSILCTFGPTKGIALLQLERWSHSEGALQHIASWDAPCPLPDLECDQVLNVHYFSDTLTTCLVLAGGDIIVVREEFQPGEEKIEIVGSVDAGISAAAWSPDGELLAVTTRAATILFMTREFENVTDITMTAEDLKASNHVSVGWGKAETQFKGKNAKVLRDPTMPEKVDEGVLSMYDDRNTTVSWRGDGNYVAVSSIETDSRRVIRVYSRDGSLESVSEPVDSLEGALSWRPAGNIIAAIQRLEDHVDVVFFERNGLRHGNFSLRLTKEEMDTWGADISLKWNVDSSILAVCFKDRVQLWTMGNYHYYLKQEIFSSTTASHKKTPFLNWHPEKPFRFSLSSEDRIQRLDFDFASSIGPTSPPNDYGVVAVIDGRILKLTPLRLTNVPPPMASHEIFMDENILDVTVHTENPDGRLVLIGVLQYSGVSLYEWALTAKPPRPPILKWFRKILEVHPLRNGLIHANMAFESVGVSVLTSNYASPEIRISDNGSLFADQRLLARNCTSFLVTPAHLIFTTGQHLLKFVHMAPVEDLDVPPDTPESDERCRSIERGARLVTVMPSIFALVMQMPRGNLETIYPRALVLAGIRHSINEKKYRRAFLACRSQRVDMNILHDHNPQQFLSDVKMFVDQVKEREHIDLFLSQLREEDVSKAMYKETLRIPPADTSPTTEAEAPAKVSGSKVNRICDAFLNVLEARAFNHVQNITTAHVCKIPPDLDAGLAQIGKIRTRLPDHVDRAIEHICFLADVNRLYENALGLYDLDLTLLIAQQSQKDPREYLPFLQSLQEMSALRRQYSIDNYLCRYRKALKHLCELGAFDEVKAYVVKHDLHQEALDLYRYQPENLSTIMRLYADHLYQNLKYKEAGIGYEYLSDHPSASSSYRLAHLWRESLSNACLIPLPPTELHSLASTLASSLTDSKDYYSAATIHLDYLSDIPTSAQLFCKGCFFADALRIVSLHRRPELLDSVIDAGLMEGMATMIELLADCKSQLNAQIPRIRELRAKKAEDPLAFFDGDINGGPDIPDNISLAATDASTTGSSLFTRYTSRTTTGTLATNATRKTSKNRRRDERKRARGKKGSVYEEEYLVNSVARLIERVNAVRDEVGRLVVGLMRRGMRERARAVEAGMAEVVGLCRGCVGEVFGRDGKEGAAGKDGEERPAGADGAIWDNLSGEPGGKVPVVQEFGKLCLLGL